MPHAPRSTTGSSAQSQVASCKQPASRAQQLVCMYVTIRRHLYTRVSACTGPRRHARAPACRRHHTLRHAASLEPVRWGVSHEYKTTSSNKLLFNGSRINTKPHLVLNYCSTKGGFACEKGVCVRSVVPSSLQEQGRAQGELRGVLLLLYICDRLDNAIFIW